MRIFHFFDAQNINFDVKKDYPSGQPLLRIVLPAENRSAIVNVITDLK